MLHKASVLPRDRKHGMYCGGVVNWRTWVLHHVAKALGLHVKLEGFPLGTSRNLDRQSVEGSIANYQNSAVAQQLAAQTLFNSGALVRTPQNSTAAQFLGPKPTTGK